MEQDIVIPRGNNVGQTIKDSLKAKKLYKLVNILKFDIKRNTKERTITATITYDYSGKHNQTKPKT